METNWNGNRVGDVKYQPKEVQSIDDFKIKDSTKNTHIIAFGKGESSKWDFTKVSRKNARFHLATTKNIQRLRWFAPNLIASKPTVIRGGKCDNINDGYAIIGVRTDQLTSENGVYMFKKSTSKYESQT